ncbi:hypothetical protein [Capnocytophaga haemolytica]
MLINSEMNNLQTKNPYFNLSGLTSSEANYICERIKERLKPIQEQVSAIETHTSAIEGEPLDNFKRVENIGGKLEEIGSLYAISAYLRTAIKEKDARLEEVSKQLRELPQKAEQEIKPIDYEALAKMNEVTIDDYLQTLSLKDAVQYKEAEAKAAHIGKYIHNFDEIRQKLTKQELITFKQVGEQVMKVKHTPLYNINDLQSLQETLLSEHRQYESEVNFYKSKFREYQNDMRVAYNQALLKAEQERSEKIQQWLLDKTTELTKIKEEIASFRIVIPNIYKTEIDNFLKHIGSVREQ